jgi:hypothetical protein
MFPRQPLKYNEEQRFLWSVPKCYKRNKLGAAVSLPYVYDYITKFCKQQAEVIQNHENEHVPDVGQGEARHRKYKRLKRGGGKLTTVQ